LNLSSLLSNVRATLFVDTHIPLADEVQFRATLIEGDALGLPPPGNIDIRARESISGPQYARLTRDSGRGALVDALMRASSRAAIATFEPFALQRICRRIDFALFALDHDGGHGAEVERGVRELWLASGPDTWKAYADRRKAVLRWLDLESMEPMP